MQLYMQTDMQTLLVFAAAKEHCVLLVFASANEKWVLLAFAAAKDKCVFLFSRLLRKNVFYLFLRLLSKTAFYLFSQLPRKHVFYWNPGEFTWLHTENCNPHPCAPHVHTRSSVTLVRFLWLYADFVWRAGTDRCIPERLALIPSQCGDLSS